MDNPLHTQLYKATALTFETMGFALPSSELGDGQAKAPPEARAEVRFQGLFTGRLVLTVYGGVLPGLTSNMLGREEPVPIEDQRDALGELAQMICGNMLFDLSSGTKEIELGSPRILDPAVWDPEAPDPGAQDLRAATVRVGLDEGRAEVHLSLRRDPAAV